jgi:glutathione S-transferase
MDPLHVYTFGPGWGLPTVGPFALKLLAWLDHHGIAYQHRIENRSDRGPLGKSPWIEQGSLRMGDSDAIIRHLAAHHCLEDPTRCDTATQARNLALRIMFEERFHQVLEWELFLHPAGRAGMRAMIAGQAPPLVGPLILASMCRHFRRQLHARGIGRLPPDQIADEGRRLLDALRLCLADGGGFLGQDGPDLTDFAVWGQVAPLLCWPMRTPVADHAKAMSDLQGWHDRLLGETRFSPTQGDQLARRTA